MGSSGRQHEQARRRLPPDGGPNTAVPLVAEYRGPRRIVYRLKFCDSPSGSPPLYRGRYSMGGVANIPYATRRVDVQAATRAAKCKQRRLCSERRHKQGEARQRRGHWQGRALTTVVVSNANGALVVRRGSTPRKPSRLARPERRQLGAKTGERANEVRSSRGRNAARSARYANSLRNQPRRCVRSSSSFRLSWCSPKATLRKPTLDLPGSPCIRCRS